MMKVCRLVTFLCIKHGLAFGAHGCPFGGWVDPMGTKCRAMALRSLDWFSHTFKDNRLRGGN